MLYRLQQLHPHRHQQRSSIQEPQRASAGPSVHDWGSDTNAVSKSSHGHVSILALVGTVLLHLETSSHLCAGVSRKRPRCHDPSTVCGLDRLYTSTS